MTVGEKDGGGSGRWWGGKAPEKQREQYEKGIGKVTSRTSWRKAEEERQGEKGVRKERMRRGKREEKRKRRRITWLRNCRKTHGGGSHAS
jgi:hypothetical protein